MVNLPTIQIHVAVNNLTIYYHQVKDNRFDLPDFSHYCPICGAKDCAKFFTFYTREAVDEKGTYFKALPIARFKCCGKGRKMVFHNTFSLLPYQLIPYSKYSISFVMKIIEMLSVGHLAIDKILDNVANFNDREILQLCARKIRDFKKLILLAQEKILTKKAYGSEIEITLNTRNITQRLKLFVEFAYEFVCNKADHSIRGPCALAYDYYLLNGSFQNNAQFLFGTPSQFRNL